jgi:hypothetical protein
MLRAKCRNILFHIVLWQMLIGGSKNYAGLLTEIVRGLY